MPLGAVMSELADARLNVQETRHLSVKSGPTPSCGIVLEVVKELQEMSFNLCACALHVWLAHLGHVVYIIYVVNYEVLIQTHVGRVDHSIDLRCLRDTVIEYFK